MMLEQSAHIFLRLGPLLGAWGAPGGPLGAPKLAKMGIAGYSQPWRPQIGGTAGILAGSGWDTSRLMYWNL